MSALSSMVLYRPDLSAPLTKTYSSTSVISSQFLTQQTGTAIATELLYRLLYDILNRLLASCRRLASKGVEECSSFIEHKMQERRDRLSAAKKRPAEGLKIMEEVDKLAERKGFLTCPLTGHKMDANLEGRKGPPMWVKGVLEGIEEGRMLERDFCIHMHEG